MYVLVHPRIIKDIESIFLENNTFSLRSLTLSRKVGYSIDKFTQKCSFRNKNASDKILLSADPPENGHLTVKKLPKT